MKDQLKMSDVEFLLTRMTQTIVEQSKAYELMSVWLEGLTKDIEDLYRYLGIEQGESGVKRVRSDA